MFRAQFSPDGRWVAAGGQDRLVHVWEMEKDEKKALDGHRTWVSSLVFHPKEKKLFTADYLGVLQCWNYEKGDKPIWTIAEADRDNVRALVVTSDGKHLISAGDDAVIKVWETSKGRPLINLVHALGIPHVGLETADLLVREFGSLRRIGETAEAELMAIAGIGPTVGKAIREYFDSQSNQIILRELEVAGVSLEKMEPLDETRARGKLWGKKIVITGTLDGFTRNEAERAVKSLGGAVGNSVTSTIDFLIVGTEPGTKLNRARQLGIEILNETEFITLLR